MGGDTEPARSEPDDVAQGTTARASHRQRDASDRKRNAHDTAYRGGHGNEREASGDAEGASRSLPGRFPSTDGQDVEGSPFGVTSIGSVGLKSTRPRRSERYAGRTSAGTGHAGL